MAKAAKANPAAAARSFHRIGIRAACRAALAVLLLAWQPGVHALTVSDHVYEDSAAVGAANLKLNGAGVRAVAWFKAFSAGLYVKEPSRDAATLLADTGAKRLRIRMLVDVGSEEFVKAFRGGVSKRASPALQARLAARMDRFDAQVRALGQLKKNDVVDLDYLPGRGMQLSLNEKVRGEPIEGADLYAAMLDIYIGERPVDAKLKAGLLGAPS